MYYSLDSREYANTCDVYNLIQLPRTRRILADLLSDDSD
jgi:hypothetical protein